ncbi:NO-inducible flavohemoprotein [Priestia koreensis]|uniref:NO-inducible flavohemoprotein n=1 Tax=Priestia koreensis TaxID=284581 RepID=UPI00203F92AA|nr:NO-inducible flavohemoprotein [Priestia koreensis]MCM3006071.1 NO-inducible flavohemoprotein [Priestia koreensis]
MLSNETIQIIKSTVPVLEQKGKDITTRFYSLMFQDHPELLNVFNHSNQKNERQQTALAKAVYAAAANIDQLDKIIPVVKQVAHKHRSIGVKPEQYPIVGEYLLKAIKDVLGEAATPEIMNAWAETYGVLAQVFIDTEKEMYEAAEKQAGGWEGYKNFFIDRKVQESEGVLSFYLKPVDHESLPSFLPGQYISVRVKQFEHLHIRQYSLSDAPNEEYFRITVKQETNKEGQSGTVSSTLHHFAEGEVLEVSAPAGEFVYETTENPVVFISGGVGVTPLVSMAKKAVEENENVTFIQAVKDRSHQLLANELKQLNLRYMACYEQATDEEKASGACQLEGYITKDWLQEKLTSTNSHIYLCGPIAFMKVLYGYLVDMGVTEEYIHYEVFGPSVGLA